MDAGCTPLRASRLRPAPMRPWHKRLRRAMACRAMRLLRLRESRERIARGFSLGLIVNFMPSFGFGVLISGFVARVFGGNLAAGIAGGASLTFLWPLLFYLNMRVGAVFISSPVPIADLDDVTEEAIDALVWGKTFFVGSMVNSLVVGAITYLGMLLIYPPLRPAALRWVRRRSRAWRRAEALARARGA